MSWFGRQTGPEKKVIADQSTYLEYLRQQRREAMAVLMQVLDEIDGTRTKKEAPPDGSKSLKNGHYRG